MNIAQKVLLRLAAERIASRYMRLERAATPKKSEEPIDDSWVIRSVVARFSQRGFVDDNGEADASNQIILRQYLASQIARAEVSIPTLPAPQVSIPTLPAPQVSIPTLPAPHPVEVEEFVPQPEPTPRIAAAEIEAPRAYSGTFDELEITFDEDEPEVPTPEAPQVLEETPDAPTLLKAAEAPTPKEDLLEAPKEVPAHLPEAGYQKPVVTSQIVEVSNFVEDRVAEAKSILDAASALSALKTLGVPIDIEAYCKKFNIPFGQHGQQESKVVEQPKNAELDRSFAERNAAFLADLKDYSKLGLTFDLAQLAALHGVPVPTKKDDLDDL